MKRVSLEGSFAVRVVSNCPADGFSAGEEFPTGAPGKRREPKHPFCSLFRGRHGASAVSDCFWAKYWEFSVPTDRD